jgi:hypothetical protein
MSFFANFKTAVFGKSSPDQSPSQPKPQTIPVIDGLHPAIVAELMRLELFQPRMSERAICYVAQGGDDQLPDQLQAIDRTLNYSNEAYRKFQTDVGTGTCEVNKALMRGEIAPSAQLFQLMKLRQGYVSHYRRNNYDKRGLNWDCVMLFSGIRTAISKAAEVEGSENAWQRAISLRNLVALMTCCGGKPKDVFDNLLGYNSWEFKSNWHGSEAGGALIRSFPDAFIEAFDTAGDSGRSFGLSLLAHHDEATNPAFLPRILKMLDKSHSVGDRAAAKRVLSNLDEQILLDIIATNLKTADIEQRLNLVQIAGTKGKPVFLDLLREHQKVERAAKVSGALATFLETSQEPEPNAAASSGPATSYRAITGEEIAIPPLDATLLSPLEDSDLEYADKLLDMLDRGRATMREEGKTAPKHLPHAFDPITPTMRETFIKRLHGPWTPSDYDRLDDLWLDFHRDPETLVEFLQKAPLKFSLRACIASRVDLADALYRGYSSSKNHAGYKFLDVAVAAGLDHRILHVIGDNSQAHSLNNRTQHYKMQAILAGNHSEAATLNAGLWPLYAENLAIFDQLLGLATGGYHVDVPRTLTALSRFPAVPQRYYARLFEIALTEKRGVREQAAALLKPALDLDKRLEASLDDARQNVRIMAATWLADLRATGSEAALRKRLKKEKSDPVRTALVGALSRLGADLSDIFAPLILIDEATKALAKSPVSLPDWIPFKALPSLGFKDGSAVPSDLLSYWLSLAIKLKDPSATGQFGMYLDQLRPEDARMLSTWVLDAWLVYDTQVAGPEEAHAFAVLTAPQDFYVVHNYKTLAARIVEITRERTNTLVNSGTDTKGMMALACRADSAFAAERVRWYLKKHGRRSHQAMALLDMLVGIGTPTALQVVIAASVRLKQKSTQKHAGEIAARYAEDRGWSVDELADRTIPTAGFDDEGVLDLPIGEDEKPYCARLDAALNIHIFTAEGKEIKALPSGEDEVSKESKKAYSTAKKELKQIVDMQTARLFEAMCSARTWVASDWKMAFYDHPVMRRMIERLVWQGMDGDNKPTTLFRPTQEGDFTDANENRVDINAFTSIRLAHGTLVDPEISKAWIGHLKDYEISPLIKQFGQTRVLLTPAQEESTMIEDRVGFVAPSMTYRGLAEKRGYERVMGDGGGCNEYAKTFPSLGLIANIHHTGSYAVDENNQVALTGLSFTNKRYGSAMTLKNVPPVLLAECWADFHALAEKGVYDAEWEKVSPW